MFRISLAGGVMSTMQVLVYDDQPEIGDSLANKVRAVYDKSERNGGQARDLPRN